MDHLVISCMLFFSLKGDRLQKNIPSLSKYQANICSCLRLKSRSIWRDFHSSTTYKYYMWCCYGTNSINQYYKSSGYSSTAYFFLVVSFPEVSILTAPPPPPFPVLLSHSLQAIPKFLVTSQADDIAIFFLFVLWSTLKLCPRGLSFHTILSLREILV